VTGYVYRGKKREGLPDLETVNAAIMKARLPGALHEAHTAGGLRLQRDVTVPEGSCRKGHRWTITTVSVRADGTRRCLTCRREARARRKEQAA